MSSGRDFIKERMKAIRQDTETGEQYRPTRIDWSTFWDIDHTQSQWLVEPLFALGRSHTVYAAAKAGKSLLVLETCAALATGKPTLYRPESVPLPVIYLDYEMTQADLQERLFDMGYGPEVDLSNLHYYQLQAMPPLDTKEGGQMLTTMAFEAGAALVVVDTTARAVEGDEHDAHTIHDFSRHTGMPLKAAGITAVRLDHAGKDITKGQRGTSAKTNDVDIVWQLTVAESNTGEVGVKVRATHRRMGWVPEVVNLHRLTDPLRHEMTQRLWLAGSREVADQLDSLAVPVEASVRKAAEALRNSGAKHKTTVIADAVRYRKECGKRSGNTLFDPLGYGPETVGKQAGKQSGHAGNRDLTIVGNTRVPIGDTVVPQGANECGEVVDRTESSAATDSVACRRVLADPSLEFVSRELMGPTQRTDGKTKPHRSNKAGEKGEPWWNNG